MASTPGPSGGTGSKVIKVLVVGGPETGKSCLLQCYNGAPFDEMYAPTLKSDLIVKEMKIGSHDVSAQMWDIGGSSPMGKSFLRGTHAVLLVVDLTSCGSMDGLDATYERVKGLAGFADDSFPCALVGNKLDLVSPSGEQSNNTAHVNHGNREVTMDDLRLWAKARRPSNPDSISFYEASAKHGTNVAEIFENLVCLAFTQPAKHLSTPAASLAQGGGSIYGGSDYSSASRTPLNANLLSDAKSRDGLRPFGQTPPNTNLSYLAGIIEGGRMPQERKGDDDLATAKVIIAGSPRVGKTCILRRFVGDDTQESLEKYEPTIGADFRIAQMPVSNDKLLTLQLWDSAGDEKTLSIGRSIYKNADCLVLVYDITSRESFDALKLYWSNYIMYGRPYEQDEFPCLLVGNKCDLGDRRAVPLEEVLDWCTYQRPCKPITYMECSALRSINIRDIFVFVGDAIYDYTLRVDNSGTEEDTENEDTGSAYTTETGDTERSYRKSNSARHLARSDRDRAAPKTPRQGDKSMEHGCWMFSCIGL